MSAPYIDADVIIRLLTGDDLAEQKASLSLFQQVEHGDLVINLAHTVIADVVYVLTSKRLYNRSKAEAAELLLPLISLSGVRIQNRSAVLTALQLYGRHTRLDFTDALLIGLMQHDGPPVVYSYDTDNDRISGIERVEP